MKRFKAVVLACCFAAFAGDALFAPVPAFGQSESHVNFVPVGPVHLVKPNGSVRAFKPGANTDAARGAALLQAVAAAVDGDVLKLGPGTFQLGPDDPSVDCSGLGTKTVHLIGSGMDTTRIERVTAPDSLGAAVVRAGNADWRMSRLTIGYGNPYDGDSPPILPLGATDCNGFRIDSCRIQGHVDAVLFGSGIDGLFEFIDCDIFSNFDAIISGTSSGSPTLRIVGCTVLSDGTAVGDAVSCVKPGAGFDAIEIIDSSLVGRDGGASSSVVGVQISAGQVLTLLGSTISTGGAGLTHNDIVNSSGTVNVDAATQYDPAKTTGTITKLPLYGTTPTTTGLAAVGASDAAALRNAAGATTGVFPVASGGTGVGTLTGIAKGNGTGAFTAAAAGTDYQGVDAELTSIAGLTSAADRVPYYTGSGTAALATYTAAARALDDDADAAAQRRTLGIVVPVPVTTGSVFSPADGATYFFGQFLQASNFSTSATFFRIYLPAGRIVGFKGMIYSGNGSASNNASTLYVRINNTTDSQVSDAIVFPATGATPAVIDVSGLTIDIAAGDYIEMKLVCPTWATNPTNGAILGSVLFQQ